MADELDFTAILDESAFTGALDAMSGQLESLSEVALQASETMSASMDNVVVAVDNASASFQAGVAAIEENTTALSENAVAADAAGVAQDTAGGKGKALSSQFGALTLPMLLATVAVGGLGIASLVMAGNFQAGMTTLVTGAGEAQSNIKMVSDGVLQMAVDTGTSTKSLTDGLFMIESANYHGAAALDILKASAEGAKVGNADLGAEADAVTTVMKDYSDMNITASESVNILTATVANGKTHLNELAPAMASVLPIAAVTKVNLIDVAGAMSTMTGMGVKAADASTYLRQLLQSLANPAAAGAKALKSVGLSAQEVSDDMKKSLPDTLQMIVDAVGKKFPAGSIAYTKALTDIAGGQKKLQGLLDLGVLGLKDYKNNVTSISGAVEQGGKSITGWSDVQKDFNYKIDTAKEGVLTFMTSIGTNLLPVVGQMVTDISSKVMPSLTRFSSWASTHGPEIANDIKVVAVAIGVGLVIALGMATVAFVAANAAAIGITLVVMGISLAVALIITHWKQFSAFLNSSNPGLVILKVVLAAVALTLGVMLVDAAIAAVAAMIPMIAAAWAAAAAFIAATLPLFLIALAIVALILVIKIIVDHWHQITGAVNKAMAAFDKAPIPIKILIALFLGPLILAVKAAQAVFGFFAHGGLAKIGELKDGAIKSVQTMAGIITGNFVDMQIKAAQHADQMKMKVLTNFVDMHMQAVSHLKSQREQVLAELAATTDPAKKHALQMKLNVINAHIAMEQEAILHTEQQKAKVAAHMKLLAEEAKHHADLMKLGVIGHIIEMGEVLGPTIAKIVTNFLNKMGELKDKALQKAKDLWTSITTTVASWPGDMLKLGDSIIQGLIKGIEGAAAGAVNAVKNVGSNILGGLKNVLGIHSPSQVMADEVGGPIVAGMAQGILAAKGVAHSALQQVGNGLVATGQTIQGSLLTPGSLSASTGTGRSGQNGAGVTLSVSLDKSIMLLDPATRRQIANDLVTDMGAAMTRHGLLQHNFALGYSGS